jgi:hypothetical protein
MVLPRVTIRLLSDDVLLEIFYTYRELVRDDPFSYGFWDECWPRLVHVCRRWRFLIFASPHRLNLRLICTPIRPVRKMLDIWPAFPLVISFNGYTAKSSEDHFDNLIAALERRDRVHQITARKLPGFVWERITAMVQEPFPALTALRVLQSDELAVGDIFLNGSAPNLQHLYLEGISIPR